MRCVTTTDESVSRIVCAPQKVTNDIKVELPETPQPLVTRDGAGLEFKLALPEPLPAEVVISAKDIANVRTELPAEVAVVVPLPPAAPQSVIAGSDSAGAAAQRSAVQPPERADVVDAPYPAALSRDIMQAAIQSLKSRNRVNDRDAAAVLSFYADRQFAPLWIGEGSWTPHGRALREQLAAAGDDGLDPKRYPSVSQIIQTGLPNHPALAMAEAQLVESVILYARDASNGRVQPRQIHPLLTPDIQAIQADDVLRRLSTADMPGKALQAFNPPHPQYRVLRTALAKSRTARETPMSDHIPEGPPLRIGMRDPRVPLIRARLGLGYSTEPVFDRQMSIRVATLQKSGGLPMTGVFTPQTRRILTGDAPSVEEAEIIANMEFWRWLPRDLGADHIFVNVPSFALEMKRSGVVVHRAKTIVGTSETQTPFFSDEMDHIVVNPSWYVPPGILKKDPRYLDPQWAAARGYEIKTRGKITTVRVPPGASNALGYVKFMFPNDHAVYLHDTPKRGLFSSRNRTLSNGCVRVENPFQLAALLFASEGWSEERFKKQIGGGERYMKLPRKLPIHLAYFTLFEDADGVLTRHPDVYGHSARLRQLLGLS